MADKLADRDAFQSSSMAGFPGAAPGTGRLSGDDRAQYEADREQIAYTVRSYNTPVAWVLQDGTYREVEQRFSQTTAKHKAAARRAFATT